MKQEKQCSCNNEHNSFGTYLQKSSARAIFSLVMTAFLGSLLISFAMQATSTKESNNGSAFSRYQLNENSFVESEGTNVAKAVIETWRTETGYLPYLHAQKAIYLEIPLRDYPMSKVVILFDYDNAGKFNLTGYGFCLPNSYFQCGRHQLTLEQAIKEPEEIDYAIFQIIHNANFTMKELCKHRATT